MVSLYATVTALIVSLAVIPVMIRLAPRLHMLDQPNARKVHLSPMPRVGGWGITIGALIAIVMWQPADPVSLSFVLGATALLVSGAWDDRGDLPPVAKLVVQVSAAIPVVLFAGLSMTDVALFPGYALPAALALPLTVMGLVTCINAANTSDGLDGLAAGVTLLSFLGLLYLAYTAGTTDVLVIAAAAVGGLAGFLRYNTHPARIFMGDAGSQFLGFAVGFLGLALVHASPEGHSPWILLLLVGLPAADLAVVTARRCLRGKHPFHADKTHVHHRLMNVGFSHNQAVIAIYTVQASFVFFGVALQTSLEWIILSVYALHLVLLYGFVALAEQAAPGRPRGNNRVRPDAPRPLRPLLVWAPRVGLELLIPLALITMTAVAVDVPAEFAALALGLLGLLALRLFRVGAPPSLVTRVPVFMTVAAVVYLYTQYPPFDSLIAGATEAGGIAVIALLAFAAVRYSPGRRQREFRTSALDYLLLILAVLTIVALFHGSVAINPLFLVYTSVLLYGAELLLVERRERWDWLLLSVAVALLLMLYRGPAW